MVNVPEWLEVEKILYTGRVISSHLDAQSLCKSYE